MTNKKPLTTSKNDVIPSTSITLVRVVTFNLILFKYKKGNFPKNIFEKTFQNIFEKTFQNFFGKSFLKNFSEKVFQIRSYKIDNINKDSNLKNVV